MKRQLRLLVISLILVMSLSGCVPRVRNVLVTNYPTEYLIKELAGNRVNVDRIDSGHAIQSAQAAKNYKELIQKGDVIFYINDLQPYWELIKDDLTKAEIKMIDLSEFTSLYPFKRYTKLSGGGSSVAVVEGEYYDGITEYTTDMYQQDPVLWVDPKTMTSMASTMKDWLVETYPDDKAIFETNFERMKVDLVRLQADYSLIKQTQTPIQLVTMSPSFGNWQQSFDISIFPVVMSKYGVLPTEDELTIIRERIINEGVEYIVLEEGMDAVTTALYTQLKTELDLKEIKLSTLYNMSRSDQASNVNYITKMYQNLETLEAIDQ